MKSAAFAAVIAVAFAAAATASAQNKAPRGAPFHAPKLKAAMPTLPPPGGPGKFAAEPPGAGPKSPPPVGVYHYRVVVTDGAGNSAKPPKLVDEFSGAPETTPHALGGYDRTHRLAR